MDFGQLNRRLLKRKNRMAACIGYVCAIVEPKKMFLPKLYCAVKAPAVVVQKIDPSALMGTLFLSGAAIRRGSVGHVLRIVIY
jgi:hypothetical protein